MTSPVFLTLLYYTAIQFNYLIFLFNFYTNLATEGKNIVEFADNAQPDGNGGYLPCLAPSIVKTSYNEYKAADATLMRPVFVNFGRGVSDVGWFGRGMGVGV